MDKVLIILELANNHMGDLQHGLEIIDQFHKICKNYPSFDFAFKFQYRDLSTFIHKNYSHRNDLKYIKRFNETKLDEKDFLTLKAKIQTLGYKAICTPFDEVSLEKVINEEFDYIKIASCSFDDWPLLSQLVKSNKPLILSTAGADYHKIQNVVNFLTVNSCVFSLLHCVAEYPTQNVNNQLYTIKQLKHLFSEVSIGFSSHEDPSNTSNAILAYSLGARIFEKHIALENGIYTKNAYSVSPTELELWLDTLQITIESLGDDNINTKIMPSSTIESLRSLKRFVFSKKNIEKGERINLEDIYYAIPGIENQISVDHLEHETKIFSNQNYNKDEVILNKIEVQKSNSYLLNEIKSKILLFLHGTSIEVPNKTDVEISSHFGLESFYKNGCTLFNFFNYNVCKKYILLLPGQEHPPQFHKVKEEVFYILHGSIELMIEDEKVFLKKGDHCIISPNKIHSFRSDSGAIIEEISTTHDPNDSYYTDKKVLEDRKIRCLYNKRYLFSI